MQIFIFGTPTTFLFLNNLYLCCCTYFPDDIFHLEETKKVQYNAIFLSQK